LRRSRESPHRGHVGKTVGECARGMGTGQDTLAEAQAQTPQPVTIPVELQEAFADAGRRMPDVWPKLSAEAKKQLLRTIVTGVNLRRQEDGLVQIRIVWCGGLVSECTIRQPVSTRRRTE